MGIVKLQQEFEVETVGELKAALADLPDDMSVSDSLGELLCMSIYEEEGRTYLEVA